MKVTRVHVLLMFEPFIVILDTDQRRHPERVEVSSEMVKILGVDCHNRVVDGLGHITPTPWGWCWREYPAIGHLPAPPKLSEVWQPDMIDSYHENMYRMRRRRHMIA